MNKRQKEVIQSQLDAEKEVLEQLEKHYRKALSDIDKKIRLLESDELTQSRIYQIEYQKALKGQVNAILEKLHGDEYSTIQEFLSASYTDAFIGTMYDMHGQGVPLVLPIDPKEAVKAVMTDSKISEGLYSSIGVDTTKLKKSISAEITRGLASSMSHNEIARNIANAAKAPLSRAKTIVRTESHRIQQASKHDAQKAAKKKGADVVKQWDSTMDGETRPTHRQLDGQIREVDEPFEADGKKAMYPGDFGDPAEDCNCRCESMTRATWGLDEGELEVLKERAEFFGLDKTKELEEFKEKYLKASEFKSILGDGTIELHPVTKSSYKKVAKNIPDTWDATQKAALKKAFTGLLKDVEGVELGAECGAVYSRNMELLGKFAGEVGRVNIPAQDVPYIVIHNHPDCLLFSSGDIRRFLENGELEVMFAIGNDGSVYMLEKMYDYNAIGFADKYLNIEKDHPKMMDSPSEYVKAIKEFLEDVEQYGVRYYEGTT